MGKLFFRRALTEHGWTSNVAVTIGVDGRIQSLETGIRPSSAWDGDVAVPGLPNLHSHGFQRGMAGLAERAVPGRNSFWSWRETMYRFVDRLDPGGLAAITAMAYAEMLESGFTSVAEFHYLHHQPDGGAYDDPAEMAGGVVAAATSTGIALTLLPVFYAYSDFGSRLPEPRQRRFTHSLDGYANLLDRCGALVRNEADIQLGAAPHSLRAVAPEEVERVAALTDGPVHIHISEQRKEVDHCLAWSGVTPVELLYETVEVDSRWCLIHATHASEQERSMIGQSGAVVGLCPITEANLGDGVFSLSDYRHAGGRFGIGSDSNILISAPEELRWLEYGQRLSTYSRNVLGDESWSTGRTLLENARLGGAQACGRDAALAVGKKADIVSLKGHALDLREDGDDALIDYWVFAAPDRIVDSVWVGGLQVVIDGSHKDRLTIENSYREVIRPLLAA